MKARHSFIALLLLATPALADADMQQADFGEKLADGVDTTSTSTKHPDKFVDSQRPGSIGFEPFSIT